ncbi:PorT family protein [Aggregatimonas sangjinii]|uniref:PorT family protein n=1 Tax=Aggregatimonas sangjinii TaxID=2583587 RepID=A0A5B7SQS2_9FLAO|nr:porin family protein [Aggregatimonas sangjinii]QCX00572.1 PorT family protein [Aggregatimonas sangjinii]
MKVTKSILLCAVFALIGATAFSQSDSGFGIKGGLNYNGNGDYFESIGDAAREPDRNLGFHIGLYGKLELGRLYVRPEVFYTKTKSDYDDDTFDMSKIDLPVLLGAKIIGPVHIFAGPSFQYIINTEYDGITIEDIENDFSVGLHFGGGVNLGKLGIDLRYERGFGDNEGRFINTNITSLPQSRIDTRPEQLILSLSYRL